MNMKIEVNDVFTVKKKTALTEFLTIGERVVSIDCAEVKRGNKVICVRRSNGKLVNVMASQLLPVPETRTNYGFELLPLDKSERPVALLAKIPQHHVMGCLLSTVQYMLSTIYKREDGEYVLDVYLTGLCTGDLEINAEIS